MNTKNKTTLPTKSERHQLFGSVDPIPGTKPKTKEHMPDLQNMSRDFLFDIETAGICNVKYPILLHSELTPKTQHTIATIEASTSLGQFSKGINMSRLTELIEEYNQKKWGTDLPTLCDFTQNLADRMEQSTASIKLAFPWFFERTSPVLNKNGLMHADAFMEVTFEDSQYTAQVGMSVNVTTLCPCSKEISEYSAHNQRGIVSMRAELFHPLDMREDWKVQLLEAAESNASCMLHPVLKRPDEKAVTEKAYENPRFVEDMVRLVAADLYELDWIRSFTVECRNEESIHLHDAIARISYTK